MDKDTGKTAALTVAEALQQDVGRSIARLPSDVMSELQANPGDVVEIKGRSKAVAIAWRAYPDDEGKMIVRIDGTTRFNADTNLSSKVEVRKVHAADADTVVLAPLEDVQFSGDPTPYFHQRLLDKPVIKGQRIAIDVMGTQLHYVVTHVHPNQVVLVDRDTELEVSEQKAKAEATRAPDISYEDIGGLRGEIDMIREMVELPMKHPEVFERLGVGAPKGVLLTGPPGTGKTLLARAVASETDARFFSIAGPEIVSKYFGESEKHIRDVFAEAEKSAPSIVFIDEIDSIAPKRGEGRDQTEKRIVAQLLTLMDGLKGRGSVVVMAATNRPDDIDEALRRPGRFDREIRINPPDEQGRREILQIHTRGMPLAKDVDLDEIAERTIGFTGADLEVLCKEAALKALKPYVPSLKEYSVQVPANVLEKLEVSAQHFHEALAMVEPSAMREVLINRPRTRWADIGGLEGVKRQLQEIIELPLKHPDLFAKAGITPPKGVLLYGPPGTGKTLLAKAVANEANANFISIKGPELVSKWVGESEKHIRDIFRRARQVAPAVIFFDEFDSISKVRGSSLADSTERMVNQLLTEIDGVEELEKVTIIAATNRPDLIDPSLLRPGRIEAKIEIPLPDERSRRQILEVHTDAMPLVDVDIGAFVQTTRGWSGAQIAALCREAGMNAIRDATREGSDDVRVEQRHFEMALQEVTQREAGARLDPFREGQPA